VNRRRHTVYGGFGSIDSGIVMPIRAAARPPDWRRAAGTGRDLDHAREVMRITDAPRAYD
jgi:hypothetical protein